MASSSPKLTRKKRGKVTKDDDRPTLFEQTIFLPRQPGAAFPPSAMYSGKGKGPLHGKNVIVGKKTKSSVDLTTAGATTISTGSLQVSPASHNAQSRTAVYSTKAGSLSSAAVKDVHEDLTPATSGSGQSVGAPPTAGVLSHDQRLSVSGAGSLIGAPPIAGVLSHDDETARVAVSTPGSGLTVRATPITDETLHDGFSGSAADLYAHAERSARVPLTTLAASGSGSSQALPSTRLSGSAAAMSALAPPITAIQQEDRLVRVETMLMQVVASLTAGARLPPHPPLPSQLSLPPQPEVDRQFAVSQPPPEHNVGVHFPAGSVAAGQLPPRQEALTEDVRHQRPLSHEQEVDENPMVWNVSDVPEVADLEDSSSQSDSDDYEPVSEQALLKRGVKAAGAVAPHYVSQVHIPLRPGGLGAPTSGSVLIRFNSSPVVTSWIDFHLNRLRGLKASGADPWIPGVSGVDEFRPVGRLPQARKLFGPRHPILVDPDLPPPARRTEEEINALLPPGKRNTPKMVAETKLVSVEKELHTSAEALEVASVLSAALSEALRKPDDKNSVRDKIDPDVVLDLLDALPAALSYAASALASGMVACRLLRRDAVLEDSALPKQVADKVRLTPLSEASLFGPFLKDLKSVTENRTPLVVEDLTQALKAVLPHSKKTTTPSTSGWGGQRKKPQKRRGFSQRRGSDGRPPQKKVKGRDSRQGPPSHGGASRQSN